MSKNIKPLRLALFVFSIGIMLIPLYGFALFVTDGNFLEAAIASAIYLLIPQVLVFVLAGAWIISHCLMKRRFEIPRISPV